MLHQIAADFHNSRRNCDIQIPGTPASAGSAPGSLAGTLQLEKRRSGSSALPRKAGICRLKPAFLGILVGILALFANRSFAVESIPLSGQWQFGVDREDVGIRERWFAQNLPDRINLPGALQSQGFGDEISISTPWVLSLYDRLWYLRDDYQAYTNAGHVKVPFVCQPPRHYLGAAWYQREIEIPKEWEGKRVVVFLERPHWESRVWLDDQLIGTNNSLCVPHEFELGIVQSRSSAPHSGLAAGKHRLTVRVDNRLLLPYRPDAHAISDSLNSTWNGIVGKMELRSTPPVWIDDLQIHPDFSSGSVRFLVTVGNLTGKSVDETLFVQILPEGTQETSRTPNTILKVLINAERKVVEGRIDIHPKSWDEFSPALYSAGAVLRESGSTKKTVTGFRQLLGEGTRLLVNHRETHLRGTHHGGDFPLTGYPPTDVDYWRKVIRTCQEWGMNHMRFHSFCPPEAAFEAADELGFYLQPEPGMWNIFDPGSPMEKMLYLETERMLKAYGNHPSFVTFSPSNEPKGRWKQVLPQWAGHFRKVDPRRLYTSGTGFTDSDAPGPLDEVDFTATQRFASRRVRGEPGWFGRDYSSSLAGVTVPVVTHENGQWCAYPDYDVIRKFTGYMRPGNYEIFRDSLAKHGLLDRNKDFAWASGRFQLACYKEEIEANLRTPGLAGFQLLDLHEYVGQGTALVGLLDPFWEPKGYVDAAEFRRFCGTTVPLARLTQRTFTMADRFDVAVEVAHYGSAALTNATVAWQIVDRRGKVAAKGEWSRLTVPIGRSALGRVNADLGKMSAPEMYRLVVAIKETEFENDWNFWVYPTRDIAAIPADVLVTRSWDEAETKLATGAKVLFLPRNADLDWTSPPLDSVPVFWNRLMNPAWGRMLGLWCDTNHPALAGFPTEPNCDWQWTQITRGVRPVNLGPLPAGLQPIVQAIDDWNRNWKLGGVFECRVGPGRLMVCAFDLTTEPQRRPVARQLFRSLLDYMTGGAFQPENEVSAADFRRVLFDTRIMRKLEARAEGEGNPASAIDGDPNTIWVAGGSGRNATGSRHPHVLTLTFPKPAQMSGVVLMPRQNDRDHIGDVRDYRLEISDDGQSWREISGGTLPSSWAPQRIEFQEAASARHLRFTAISGYGRDRSTALAELAIVYGGPALRDPESGNIEYRRSRSTSADVDEGGDSPAIRTNIPSSGR